jgi:hypothetical protein
MAAILLGVIGLGGFFLYLICPAAGPIYCFKTFPDSPPSLAGLSVERIAVLPVPRNANPSLHFGWALMMCLYAWMRRSWILILSSTIFVAFTAMATVGFGEHYLIDLIVTVPLVVGVLTVCSAPAASKMFGCRMTLGVGITGGWLLCLRFGLFLGMSPVIGWSAAALTLLISSSLFSALVKQRFALSERSFPTTLPLPKHKVAA